MASLQQHFCNQLRMIRYRKGYSQENLSGMLNLSVNGYAKIERGESEATLQRVEAIANALDISVYELICPPAPNSHTTLCPYETGAEPGQLLGSNVSVILENLRLRVARLEVEFNRFQQRKAS